ncbi:MAG: NAD(P)-dependent oxidoreductase [Chthoniobacterales bacterium]
MSTSISSLSLPCAADQADDFVSRPQKKVLEAMRGVKGDVMVLGAGGKMGLHLCLMLRKAFQTLGSSQRVIAVSRFNGLRSTDVFESSGIETISCDFTDAAALEGLPSIPNIIYMAGAKFGTADNPGLLHKMNVEIPQKIAERFQKARIVVFSTGCVYSFVSPESGGSTEASPTSPPGEYAQSCLGRERAFEKVSLEHNTPIAFIRLNYAVEFHYGVLVDICQKVMRDESVDVSMGYVNVIWQGDAVAYSLMALLHCSSPPFILNVAGPEILSVRDLALRFGKLLGKEPRFTGQEEPVAWLNNAKKSRDLFGLSEVSADQMIEWVAAWLSTSGSTYGKPTGFQIRDGKY